MGPSGKEPCAQKPRACLCSRQIQLCRLCRDSGRDTSRQLRKELDPMGLLPVQSRKVFAQLQCDVDQSDCPVPNGRSLFAREPTRIGVHLHSYCSHRILAALRPRCRWGTSDDGTLPLPRACHYNIVGRCQSNRCHSLSKSSNLDAVACSRVCRNTKICGVTPQRCHS